MSSTLKPLHKDFRLFGSTSAHSTSYSYTDSRKAFANFTLFGSTSTHSTSRVAGYKYYQALISLVIKQFEETITVKDSQLNKLIRYFEDKLVTMDGIHDGTTDILEKVPMLEQIVIKQIKYFEERLTSTDLTAKFSSFESVVPLVDQWLVKITKYISEVIHAKETSDAFMFTDVTDTVKIGVLKLIDVTDTVRIGVSGNIDVTDTVNIGVIPEVIAAVTSASGASYVIPLHPLIISPIDSSPTELPIPGEVIPYTESNPWEPTIIIDGIVYATHPSTAPPSYGPQTYFVQWLDITLPGGNNSSNIQDFSFSLGFDGGTFSILSEFPIGNKGTSVSVFGLTGTITRTGKKASNSAYGYITKGIFGSPNLNKEFNIINYGNQHYIQYVGSQILYPFNIQPNQRMSVWDMCRNVAIASQTHLGFYVVDCPYSDVLGQSGQTGLEALGSLAAQIGAQLRWSGIDHYNIVYPNFFQGTYTIPSPYLLTAEGTEYETILDLGLGVTGTGVLQIPKANVFDTATNGAPLGDTSPTIIDVLYPITNKPPADSPPIKVPLPADASSAKIQIIVKDTSGTGSATGPGAGWITQDDSIWFDLGSPSISNPYVKLSDSNISYKPYVQIIPGMFPDIDAINNGEFVMNIGIERQDLSSQFSAAQDDEQNRLKDLFNRMLSNLRFIKTYEGTINCFFFGSIPLPGMWASATNICGETVEGIIESVSFSAPGILTIQVAQYLRVNFLDPKSSFTSNPSNSVI